jgi:hypothetical protein
MKHVLLWLALLVLAVAWMWPVQSGNHPPGVRVAGDPEQTNISNGPAWKVKEYTITPLAGYRIRGRVIDSERYWLGRESDLSPLDLALGWDRMSDQSVLDQLTFLRPRRALEYRPKAGDWPIPLAEIVSHCSNTHVIPADRGIERQLRDLGEGEIVELEGSLVEVTGPDGWKWRSPLVRTDDGPHACELMWVTGVRTWPPE